MTRTIVTRDGDTLDQIALGAFGVTAGATEALLVANPALADQPPVLAAGLVVVVPAFQPALALASVTLWG